MRSVATATRAPAPCARAIRSRTSSSAPRSSGVWSSTPKTRSSNTIRSGSATTISIPSGSARHVRTSIVWGKHPDDTANTVRAPPCTRRSMVMASAAAVGSSSSDAFATGMPVRSATSVWNVRSASSRPCAISAWYGVYGVYQLGFSKTLRRMTDGVTQSL